MRAARASLSVLFLSGAAHAADLRDYCTDRPGLGTPACTIDAGHASFELGLGDWTREHDAATRTDTFVGGDALLRYGLGDTTEVRLGWTAYGHVRERDRATGAIDRSSGVGDVSIGLRQNLMNPDGSGFSIALLPFATLPTGGSTIGAGDWGAGLVVPVSYDLGAGFSLGFTGEVDAAVDGDREGRHLAYGGIAGLGYELSKAVSATIEYSQTRDHDPDGHSTERLAGLSIGWMARDDVEIDGGINAGLDHASADVEVYVGVSRRF